MTRIGELRRGRLAQTIRDTLAEWISHGYAADGAEINSGSAAGGCCSDFAGEVLSRLGDHAVTDAMGLSEIGIDNLQVADRLDTVGRPLDRALLARHWPKVVPPGDLGWDDLDALSEDAGFCGLTHVWLTMDGLHFDAEAPDGVSNLFDLPFFGRVVDSWIAERRRAPAPAMG